MISALVAVDIAILAPETVARPARAISQALSGRRSGALTLDDRHIPHVTLAQQFVEHARLPDLEAALDGLLRHEPPLLLRVTGFTTRGSTVYFAVEGSPDLLRLHEQVMDAVEPFEAPEGTPHAFADDGETIRSQDVDGVRNYRESAAYTHFRPHVTLGHGLVPDEAPEISFRADRVALCHLGRFCTCRAVFREWRLDASAA